MNLIQSMVCFYGEGPLVTRVLCDCACNECEGTWIAVSEWDLQSDLTTLECPHCGYCNCDSEIRVEDAYI